MTKIRMENLYTMNSKYSTTAKSRTSAVLKTHLKINLARTVKQQMKIALLKLSKNPSKSS